MIELERKGCHYVSFSTFKMVELLISREMKGVSVPRERLSVSFSLKFGLDLNGIFSFRTVTHGSVDKSFHCEICGKSFQARRQFVAHRYSHVKQTQRCPVCKKRFYNSERLATHISMHDNIDDLPEPEIGAVTAHVNEDGELIITQDVSQSNQALILTPSSLLHVIQAPVGDEASATADAGAHDHNAEDVDQSARPEDGRPQWAFEVVIEPRP